MRFSAAVIPSMLLVLLLAILNVAAEPVSYENNKMLTSENIEAEMIQNYYLLKREEQGHGATAATATASASASATKSYSASASATASSTAPKMQGKSVMANPPILQDGTLFYIGLAVTCLLWVTGKAIDVKMERQERYAVSIIHSRI